MIIIPAIDIMGGNVVRLRRGDPNDSVMYGNNPLDFAKRWESAGADMLHIVDLDATLGRGSNTKIINSVSMQSGIPTQIAGGLRNLDSALYAASSKNRIVLGTIALTDRLLLLDILDRLGPHRVVVSLDHNAGSVIIRGWTDDTHADIVDTMDSLIDDGIQEFMITDISKDGMKSGPELELFADLCKKDANVIASGGISTINDIKTLDECGASGVILGKAIYDNVLSLAQAKDAACH